MTQYQKEFILSNYSKLSQLELANELGVSSTTIFKWLKELKLKRVYKYNVPVKEPVYSDGFFHHNKLFTI